MPSQRIVMASSPRARRASSLLPAWRSAFSSTARSKAMPFQEVTVTPGTNPGAVTPCATFVTRYRTLPLSTYSSTRNGSTAVLSANGAGRT